MSVLAAVAFLNGDESQQQPSSPKPVDQPTTTTTTTTTTPTAAPVPAPRKLDNNEKPTTAAAIQELNRIRTGGGAGVASLMSKFGQDTPPPKRSISPNKQPQPISKAAAPTPPRTPSPTSSNQSSTFEKVSSSLSSRGTPATSSLEHRSTKTTAQTKISSNSSRVNTRTNIDMMIEELTIMYQQSLDECKEAQQQLQQLKSEAETYETDSTKVRDYEIRVEYLAQKLEQVSDERDALEQELAGYRANRSNIETPVSPVFQHRLSDIFDKRSSADQNEGPPENDESNSEFMHGLLDAYEEEEEEQENHEEQQEQSMSPEEQIKYLQEQLKASDVGTKMAVQQYLAELEKERTETKALRDVVRKQDELIATLESKINNYNNSTPSTTPVVSRPPRKASLASPTYKSSNNNAAPPLPNQSNVERQLREQLESQRLELEDKRALLTQLLNEREDILKKAKMSGNGGRPGASSFDLLAELARPLDNNDNGRNTPPPTAPPRDPLPPVPNNATSPSSGRESMPSMRDDASSVTSWSAASASASAAAAAVDKHNDSVNDFEAMYANYLDSSEDANEHHLLALRRLEGPEQRSPTTTH
ncbi:predicted protein [Lichtheimia corymbifera JMRC:FSU:9682]|uniref:Uncharacterized protein n=1 Tax=Lichtheimia corymbifera JMRC:FSU:9682 TaxID=1263082 RepID=A0A068RKV0_9FUNG|nr:predicted protein [Lichtheimia corymbifera JMRC:FSU:9682]